MAGELDQGLQRATNVATLLAILAAGVGWVVAKVTGQPDWQMTLTILGCAGGAGLVSWLLLRQRTKHLAKAPAPKLPPLPTPAFPWMPPSPSPAEPPHPRLAFLPPKIIEQSPFGPSPLDFPLRSFQVTVPIKNEAPS